MLRFAVQSAENGSDQREAAGEADKTDSARNKLGLEPQALRPILPPPLPFVSALWLSLLPIIDQSLGIRDQLWVSLFSATLDFQ